MNFSGKNAVITGAGNGIGKTTALELAKAGAAVAIFDIDKERLKEVSDSIRDAQGTVLPFVVDVMKKADVKAAMAEIMAQFKHIDILVNNAGAGWHTQLPFKDTPEDDWEWILDVNVKGALYFAQTVINGMVERKYGKIINVGSIAARTGIPKLAVYSASKGAIVSFTKSLAMELGPYGINVNCVSPGMITREKDAPATDETFLGRKGTGDDIAALILFLASDKASYITGADYVIDGGRSLGPKGM